MHRMLETGNLIFYCLGVNASHYYYILLFERTKYCLKKTNWLQRVLIKDPLFLAPVTVDSRNVNTSLSSAPQNHTLVESKNALSFLLFKQLIPSCRASNSKVSLIHSATAYMVLNYRYRKCIYKHLGLKMISLKLVTTFQYYRSPQEIQCCSSVSSCCRLF